MPQPVNTLNKLHESVRKEAGCRPKQLAESDYTYGKGTQPILSFLDEDTKDNESEPEPITDFDEVDLPMDDLIDDDLAMTDADEVSAGPDTPGLQITELLADENDEYDAHAEEDDLLEDALIGAEDSYHLSSASATRAQEPLQVEISDIARDCREPNKGDQSHGMRVSALDTMASAQKANLAEDVTKKVSLFVHDSSSTPARYDTGHPVDVPAKRTLDSVLEPDSELAQPMGIANKKARMDSYDTVTGSATPNDFGWVEPQKNGEEAVAPKVDDMTKADKEEELRQWLFEEFGDSVELV